MEIFAYSCLLSALIVVEMKTLNINGRVGGNVTFTCSDWDTFTRVKTNIKYFCVSPCKDIIIKAAFGKTTNKNRIELTNGGNELFVTITNLQKSDSGSYHCGVDRLILDAYIDVNLTVLDVKSSSPKTTQKPVTVGSTLSFAVTNGSFLSSSSSDIMADLSTSHTSFHSTTPAASATQGAGSVPYLVVGVVALITILMVLLKLLKKTMRKELNVVSSADVPLEGTQDDIEPDEIRAEDPIDPESLYANYSYHHCTELAAESGGYSKVVKPNSASRCEVTSRGACAENTSDLVYSVAQLPKKQIELTGQSNRNQWERNGNDCLYSLAQLP